MSIFSNILGSIPVVGQISSVVGIIGDIAEAVGGKTGKKINDGVNMLTEGLAEAEQKPMTPEQVSQLEQAKLVHKATLEKIALADIQGGRALAKTEIASNDEYVRRTRPKLLRLYGYTTMVLTLLLVSVAAACTFAGIDDTKTTALVEIGQWALVTIAGTFTYMYRAYTGHRTQEKMADGGIIKEPIMGKLLKYKSKG